MWYPPQSEVSRLDVATRKAMIMSSVGMHHPTADVDRLYVWRSEGGRGLLNLWKATIVSLATYLNIVVESDPFLRAVESFQRELCQSKSLVSLATKFKNEYSVHYIVSVIRPTVEVRKIGVVLKKSMQHILLDNWKRKSLHGKFFDRLNKPLNKTRSLCWLHSSTLKECLRQGQF